MGKVFFSIIMSVYNDENFIEASVRSILNQTFLDFEFIVINDASNDKTDEILNSLAHYDKRIKYFKNNNNIGLTKSLNHAISLSQGEWIVRQDSDDISLPQRLKDAYNMIKAKNFDFYSTPAISFNEFKSNTIPDYLTRKFFNIDFLKYKNCLIHGTLIIRRDIMLKVMYDQKFIFSQDFKLYHDLFNSGYTLFYNQSSITYKHRIHDNRSTKTNNLDQLNFFNQVLLENGYGQYIDSFMNRIKIKLIEIKLIITSLLKN